MSRAAWWRLAALMFLAAYVAARLAGMARERPEPPRTAFVVSPGAQGRLRAAERCACGHLGAVHDPDIGCLAVACPCRRPGCNCPDAPPGPTG